MSLASNVSSLATRIATEFKTVKTLISGNNQGDLSGLQTNAKSSLVAAINEVATTGGSGDVIDDDATSESTTWSSHKIDQEIDGAVSALVGSAPELLDTLEEIAAAIDDDENFATTIMSEVSTKAPLASPALTGTPTAPTASPGTNTTQIATTAFVQQETPNASDTVVGMVELATNTETVTGTDTTRAVTPAGLKAQLDDKVGNTATDFVATFEAGLSA